MKTTRNISTITFNTPEFLLTKLNELYSARVISVWHFVCHIGEDDEAGLKNHVHLYIEPSKLLQTDDLVVQFKEIDPTNEKPLKPLPFRLSNFVHWYLYGIHDKVYLANLNPPQKKKFEYTYNDVKTSNSDELYRAVKQIDKGSLIPIHKIQEAVENKVPFSRLVATGQVPLSLIQGWRMGYECILDEKNAELMKKKASQQRNTSARGEKEEKK